MAPFFSKQNRIEETHFNLLHHEYNKQTNKTNIDLTSTQTAHFLAPNQDAAATPTDPLSASINRQRIQSAPRLQFKTTPRLY